MTSPFASLTGEMVTETSSVRSVLANSDCLEVIDATDRCRSCSRIFGSSSRRSGGKSTVIGFPMISAARIAEHSFGSGIPALHDPVEIFADNSVVGGRDDGAESSFQQSVLRDVASDFRRSYNCFRHCHE